MSLKDILHNLIKERGEVSYGQVCQLCAEEGYKSETATRRLREMTDIEPVIAKSKRGTNYISGYKWIGEPVKHEVEIKDNYATEESFVGRLFTYKVDPKHATTAFNDPN